MVIHETTDSGHTCRLMFHAISLTTIGMDSQKEKDKDRQILVLDCGAWESTGNTL